MFSKIYLKMNPKNLIETSLHQLEIKLKKISGGLWSSSTNECNALHTSRWNIPIIRFGKFIRDIKKRLIKKKYLENKINEMFL